MEFPFCRRLQLFFLFFDLKKVFQLFMKGERYFIYKTFVWNLERTIRVVEEANVRRFISEVYSLYKK